MLRNNSPTIPGSTQPVRTRLNRLLQAYDHTAIPGAAGVPAGPVAPIVTAPAAGGEAAAGDYGIDAATLAASNAAAVRPDTSVHNAFQGLYADAGSRTRPTGDAGASRLANRFRLGGAVAQIAGALAGGNAGDALAAGGGGFAAGASRMATRDAEALKLEQKAYDAWLEGVQKRNHETATAETTAELRRRADVFGADRADNRQAASIAATNERADADRAAVETRDLRASAEAQAKVALEAGDIDAYVSLAVDRFGLDEADARAIASSAADRIARADRIGDARLRLDVRRAATSEGQLALARARFQAAHAGPARSSTPAPQPRAVRPGPARAAQTGEDAEAAARVPEDQTVAYASLMARRRRLHRGELTQAEYDASDRAYTDRFGAPPEAAPAAEGAPAAAPSAPSGTRGTGPASTVRRRSIGATRQFGGGVLRSRTDTAF